MVRLLGLTGGIATGKTTVSNMFTKLGAHVLCADVIAREVVEPGESALEEIRRAFGDGVIREDGRLDRQKLGQLIFADEPARVRLNGIIHPRVREKMSTQTAALLADSHSTVIWDVPLLFEGGTNRKVQKTVVVYVDEATQLRRLMARNALTESEATSRIRAQWPIEKKRELADYIVDNRGTMEETWRQVESLWQTWQGEKKQ